MWVDIKLSIFYGLKRYKVVQIQIKISLQIYGIDDMIGFPGVLNGTLPNVGTTVYLECCYFQFYEHRKICSATHCYAVMAHHQIPKQVCCKNRLNLYAG